MAFKPSTRTQVEIPFQTLSLNGGSFHRGIWFGSLISCFSSSVLWDANLASSVVGFAKPMSGGEFIACPCTCAAFSGLEDANFTSSLVESSLSLHFPLVVESYFSF